MHENAEIGFHTNLINDGEFTDNLGFTGFYSDTDVLTVSGANRAIFNNVEIGVVNNLELFTSMGLTNELDFLEGKVITPRNQVNISLDFLRHESYNGDDDLHHVDGYASVLDNDSFVFPIGDINESGESRLRPMSIPTRNAVVIFKGAYFSKNPDDAGNLLDSPFFNSNFDTTNKQFEVETVSAIEFWDLDGSTLTTVTLTWDNLSNVNLISPDLNELIVVGWNVAKQRWENLGNTEMTGDFNSGTLTSISFIPNEYEIITLGSANTVNNNYSISPNGDDFNDTLVIEELLQGDYPFNKIVIFNRWGTIVYSQENYQNDFDGVSEGRLTVGKNKKLPVGTYFYELQYGETSFTKFKNGWVQIAR